MQRQALQDFAPRMRQFDEQERQHKAAEHTARRALRTAQQAVESGNTDIADLEADKRSLQQSAEEMEQQLASNSQVCSFDGQLMQVYWQPICFSFGFSTTCVCERWVGWPWAFRHGILTGPSGWALDLSTHRCQGRAVQSAL